MDENTNRPPLDEAARQIVRARARRHARRAGLNRHDREDLEQELYVAVWLARDGFDEARGPWPAFACSVADNAACDRLRKLRTAKRGLGRRVPQRDLPPELREALGSGRWLEEAERRDLALDIEEALARLDGEERDLAMRLLTRTVSQVARELGVARSTVAGRARRLGRHFADGAPGESRGSGPSS